MTPCEEKGYKVGQVFRGARGEFKEGWVMVLKKDDGTQNPYFYCISGEQPFDDSCCEFIYRMERIYPPEEKSEDVEVVCEGKTVVISRKSAEALNLC